MIFQPLLRQSAERDLEAIGDWYARLRPGLGADFREAVDEAISRVASNPFLYADLYRGNRRVLLRRFQYALWYRVVGDRVIFLACIHGRRDPRLIRERLREGAV